MNDAGNSSSSTPTIAGGVASAGSNEKRSLKTYVSDMLALERHIHEPVRHQKHDADVAKFPEALTCIKEIESTVDRHIAALEKTLESLGGHAASPVKSFVSGLFGGAAAAIDKVRKTEVSKDLRDDYTALALAAVSYEMLHTTALAVGDAACAALAAKHLGDYAKCVISIGDAIPSVVVAELIADGEKVDPSVAGQARQNAKNIWSTH